MNGTSLNVPQTVFCLFYAIFWGLEANAQIRWNAFDWPIALTDWGSSVHRLGLSLGLLTLFPIAVFLPLTMLLHTRPREFDVILGFQLVCAIVAAHGAFGPYRIWLSAVEKWPASVFYKFTYQPPKIMVDDTDASRDVEVYVSQPGSIRPASDQQRHYLSPDRACYNFFVGIGYIVVAVVAAGAALCWLRDFLSPELSPRQGQPS